MQLARQLDSEREKPVEGVPVIHLTKILYVFHNGQNER
jgi:hypothetical protein